MYATCVHVVLCNLKVNVKLALLCFVFVFAENSTTVIGDPLEDTSLWFWNNTDLVSFSVFYISKEIHSLLNTKPFLFIDCDTSTMRHNTVSNITLIIICIFHHFTAY